MSSKLCNFTEPWGIVNFNPVLRAHSCPSIENALRVPLLPNLQQSRIIGTPVCSLPVRLLQIPLQRDLESTFLTDRLGVDCETHFIHVGATIRSSFD